MTCTATSCLFDLENLHVERPGTVPKELRLLKLCSGDKVALACLKALLCAFSNSLREPKAWCEAIGCTAAAEPSVPGTCAVGRLLRGCRQGSP